MKFGNLGNKVIFGLSALLFSLLYGCSEDKGMPPEVPKEDIIHSADKPATPVKVIKKKVKADVEELRSLKIGVIGPETGEQGIWGQSVLKGVFAAAGRFNRQGGIDGKDIEILHYNTGDTDSPRLTELAVADLVKQKAIAIISAPTGWSTFAPIHIVNKTQTIFFSIGSRRRIARSGPYVFRSSLATGIATDDLIKYASEKLNYSDYAMVTSSQYDYSLDLSAWFKKAIFKYGGTLSVDVDTYDTYTGKQNPGKVIDAIKNKSDTLHGVIFTGGSRDGMLFAQQMRRAGLNQPVLGGEDLFTMEYLSGGDAVLDSLLYATFSPHLESTKVTEFKQDYGDDHPDHFAALAYDTFMLLAQAIKTAGSTRTSKVRDAVISIKDFTGVTGKMSFTPNGAPIKKTFIYSIINDVDGERFELLE